MPPLFLGTGSPFEPLQAPFEVDYFHELQIILCIGIDKAFAGILLR